MNMAVIVGLLPFTGNALPLISAGGSSMLVTLTSLGIVMNISRVSMTQKSEERSAHSAVVDLRRRDGRGVYPAETVLDALELDKDSVLWVGGRGGIEETLVTRREIPFKAIPAAGVHGVGLKRLPGNIWKLLKGFFASTRILREFNPDVLLFTGGYVAFPMAVAALRRPSLLYVPDIEPGMALKALARFADRIALTTDTSAAYFPNKPS